MTPKTLTVKEAAAEFGVSPATVYSWVNTNTLKSSKDAKQAIVFAVADVRALKARRKTAAQARDAVKKSGVIKAPAIKTAPAKKTADEPLRVQLLEIADTLYELANKMPVRGKK